MRHVVLVTVGTDGDVLPYVAVGRALVARGHRVTLATNEPYRALAGRCGFGFEALVTVDETRAFLGHPHLWHPILAGPFAARWGVPLIPRQFEALRALAEGEGDVVFAASPGVVAARIAQEATGVAMASVYQTPWMIASCIEPPVMVGGWSLPRRAPRPAGRLYWRGVDTVAWLVMGRSLNRLRRSLGLKPVYRVFEWWMSPTLAIGLFPQWYGRPQEDWPRQMRIAGFAMYDGAYGDAGLGDEVEAFLGEGEAPVVFTFGTGMMHAERLFAAAAGACGRLGVRGMLLTRHAGQLPGELPDGVRHFGYVPLGKLLPRCAAVVHHGGVGTAARAMAAGVGQVIVPHAWDQLDNARRVEQLGVGGVLRRRRVSVEAMAEAVKRVMGEGVGSRCAELAGRMARDADGAGRAAAWIDAMSV